VTLVSEVLYTAHGRRFKYIVYKPSIGTKFYVRKLTKTDKRIGKDDWFTNLDAAKRSVDRDAREENFV